jgi:hypothetical protein
MQEEAQLTEWNRKLEQDTEILKAAANRQHLRVVMGASNVDCDDLASIDIRTHLLTHEMAEKVVGWSISHHLQNTLEPVLRNGKLIISAERLVRLLLVFIYDRWMYICRSFTCGWSGVC